LSTKTITQVKRNPGDSQFWSALMSVNDDFLNMGRFQLQDEKEIRFWEDTCLGDTALKVQYPNLFNIVRQKSATVAEVFSLRPLNISF
jgi:hypothetical protein